MDSKTSMSNCNDFSLLSLGPVKSNDLELSPSLCRCGLKLYRQAWEAYREVDCPYGETDEAMLVWYSLYGKEDTPSPAVGKN